MVFKVKLSDGQFVEFANEPTEDDIDHVYSQLKVSSRPSSDLFNGKEIAKKASEGLQGAGEAGLGMLAGMPSMIAGGIRGLSSLAAGQGYESAAKAIEDTQKSNFGAGVYEAPSAAGKAATEKLGEAFSAPGEWAGDVAGKYGGDLARFSAKALVDMGMNFLPLHAGAKALPKTSALSALKEAKPTEVASTLSPRERMRAAQETAVQEASSEISAREQRRVEREAPQSTTDTINIDSNGVALTPENFDAVTPVRDKGNPAPIDPVLTESLNKQRESNTQGELDVGNKNRAYTDRLADSGEGGERPFTAEEYGKTLEHLEKEKTTGFTMPENKAEAYQHYLDSVDGKQAGLFDVASRTEEFNRAKFAEDVPRLVNEHPSVKNAEKLLARQEKFVADLKEQVRSGETKASALITETQALKEATKKVEEVKSRVEQDLTNSGPDTAGLSESKREWTIGPKKSQNFNSRTRKQGGGLYLGEQETKAVDQLKKIVPLEERLNEHTTVAATPEGVVDVAKLAKDLPDGNLLSKTADMFTKGFLHLKRETNNPVIKYTYDRVSEAIDAAKTKIHTLLQNDLLPQLRDLSTREFIELHGAMHDAMKGGYELSTKTLLDSGFKESQVKAWESLQRGFDSSFKDINSMLETAGKPPISKYTAYMAGMSTGDFRTVILTDRIGPDGKKVPQMVGIVGSNVKWMTSYKVDTFLKDNPTYYKGEDQFRGTGLHTNVMNERLVQAIAILSEHNPNMELFSKQMMDHLSGEAFDYKNASNHIMDKKGIAGMEGSKEWVSGWKSLLPLSPETKAAVIAKQNAMDGFRAQISYMESMAHWTELSKATDDLSKVFSDPDLQTTQKNSIAASKEYLKNAMGGETSGTGAALNAAVSFIGNFFGVGPSVLSSAIRGASKTNNAIFFGANPFFVIANVAQGAIGTPMMVNYLRSKGFNVAGIDKTGMSAYVKASMEGYNQLRNPAKDGWTKALWDYGHEHGISSTQLFEHSLDMRKGVAHYINTGLEAGSGFAEGMPRSQVYAMIANVLKDSGYKTHPDIFKVSKELTDLIMVDYRPHEGQKVNRAFGPVAPVVGALSSFASNSNSMIMSMVREAKKTKDGSALMAMLVTGLVTHGVMGFPGFDEADKLVEAISNAWGKPTTLSNEVLKLAQQHGKAGDLVTTGFGASMGLDLHQVLGRSAAMPPQLSLGTAGKTKDIGVAAFKATTSPSEMNSKRLAYELTPKLGKGIEDLTWFNKDSMAMNKKEGYSTNGLYERNSFDTKVKAVGGTSLREFKLKEQSRQTQLQDSHYKDKQNSIINKVQDMKVSSLGLSQESLGNSLDKYIEAEGDPRKFVQELKKMDINISTTAIQRYVMAKAKSGDLSAKKALIRMQENSYGNN